MFSRQLCKIQKEVIDLQNDNNIIYDQDCTLHLDYSKINNLKILDIKDNNVQLELSIYKYQQYTTRVFNINKDINTLIKYFNKFNLFRLENYFINTSKIILVQESEILKDKKLNLEFLFENGDCIEITTNYKRWDSWSNLRLK